MFLLYDTTSPSHDQVQLTYSVTESVFMIVSDSVTEILCYVKRSLCITLFHVTCISHTTCAGGMHSFGIFYKIFILPVNCLRYFTQNNISNSQRCSHSFNRICVRNHFVIDKFLVWTNLFSQCTTKPSTVSDD